MIQLIPIEKRKGVFALIQQYRGQLLGLFRDQPSAQISVSAGGGFGGFGSSLQLSIVAPDFNTLSDRNNSIIQNLQTNRYVVDVTSSLSDTSLENDFVPDPSRMKGTGITPAAIAARAADLRFRDPGVERRDRRPELSHPGAGGPDEALGRPVAPEPSRSMRRPCSRRCRSDSWAHSP